MRILLIAVLALSGLACQKEIHEVRSPAPLQPALAQAPAAQAAAAIR